MDAPPNRSPLSQAWRRFGATSAGRWVVSRFVSWKAPYFRTIGATFTRLDSGHVEAKVSKRWGITNHIGTVHAIAMCNIAELVGGCCMEVSLRGDMRWIPVGMSVEYRNLAKTDLRGVAIVDPSAWTEPGDVVVPVDVYDTHGTVVFHADITMRISWRKKAAQAA